MTKKENKEVEKKKKKGMNLPNKITIARVCMIPLFMIVLILTVNQKRVLCLILLTKSIMPRQLSQSKESG